MGLFDSVRDLVGDDEEAAAAESDADAGPSGFDPADASLDHREPTPTTFRNTAVDAVQDWEEYDLDFSLASLARLDDLAASEGKHLDLLHDSDRDDERVAELHTALTIQAGSYLGEVLVRELDGEWVRADERWAVRLPDDDGTIEVFDVAGHAFAEEPVFGALAERFSTPEPSPADDEESTPTADREEMRSRAEEVADFWSQYDLDFSPDSLARLEHLLAAEWDASRFEDVELGGEDMDSGMFTELVKQFGSYYGEVLVRAHDGTWERRAADMVVTVPGSGELPTVTARVYRTVAASLRDDGSVAETYNALLDRADLGAPTLPVDDDGGEMAESPAKADEADDAAPAEPNGAPAESADGTESETGVETSGDQGPVGEPPANGPSDTGTEESPPGGSSAERPSDPDDAGSDPATDEEIADLIPSDLGGTADESTAASAQDQAREGASTAADTDADDGPNSGATAADEDAQTPGTDGSTTNPSGEAAATPQDAAAETGDAAMADLAAEIAAGGGAGETDTGEAASVDATVEDLEQGAAAFAATWPGYDLDYSVASLDRLDRLVADEYAGERFADVDPSDGPIGDDFVRGRLLEIGGYFATVLRRTIGGDWQSSDGEPAVVVLNGADGSARVDPLAVAADCLGGGDSFAARYERVRSGDVPADRSPEE